MDCCVFVVRVALRNNIIYEQGEEEKGKGRGVTNNWNKITPAAGVSLLHWLFISLISSQRKTPKRFSNAIMMDNNDHQLFRAFDSDFIVGKYVNFFVVVVVKGAATASRPKQWRR